MRKYVIMGIQGSGKGTQAALLAQDLDLVHISVGDIFRWHVQRHTKLGAQVRRIMAAGELVGDDLVESTVRDRLAMHDWNYGFIIDGFPRTRRQAEFFLESYDIDAVIHLDLPDSEVRRRVLARRVCAHCGVDYNLMEYRPRQEGRGDRRSASTSRCWRAPAWSSTAASVPATCTRWPRPGSRRCSGGWWRTGTPPSTRSPRTSKPRSWKGNSDEPPADPPSGRGTGP